MQRVQVPHSKALQKLKNRGLTDDEAVEFTTDEVLEVPVLDYTVFGGTIAGGGQRIVSGKSSSKKKATAGPFKMPTRKQIAEARKAGHGIIRGEFGYLLIKAKAIQPVIVREPTKKFVESQRKAREHSAMHVKDAIAALAESLKISESRLLYVLQAHGLVDVPLPQELAKKKPIPIDPQVGTTLAIINALEAGKPPEENIPDEVLESWREKLRALKGQSREQLHEPNHG